MSKVLVIDDEKDICNMIENFLLRSDHLVEKTYSGLEAVKKIDQEEFDYIISDVKMPEFTGIELLEYVMNKKVKTKVILISGFSEIAEAEMKKLGVFTFFKKPLKLSELSEIIK